MRDLRYTLPDKLPADRKSDGDGLFLVELLDHRGFVVGRE
jgi:hypothetical protein